MRSKLKMTATRCRWKLDNCLLKRQNGVFVAKEYKSKKTQKVKSKKKKRNTKTGQNNKIKAHNFFFGELHNKYTVSNKRDFQAHIT